MTAPPYMQTSPLMFMACNSSPSSPRHFLICSASTTNLKLFAADDEFRNRLQLHVRSAFVDGTDLGVAPEFLDRVVFDEAVAAVEFDGLGADALGRARRIELGHRGFLDERLSGIFQPCRVIDHQARGFKLCGHLGELELHALKFIDAPTE